MRRPGSKQEVTICLRFSDNSSVSQDVGPNFQTSTQFTSASEQFVETQNFFLWFSHPDRFSDLLSIKMLAHRMSPHPMDGFSVENRVALGGICALIGERMTMRRVMRVRLISLIRDYARARRRTIHARYSLIDIQFRTRARDTPINFRVKCGSGSCITPWMFARRMLHFCKFCCA